jgi:hypothetical protein
MLTIKITLSSAHHEVKHALVFESSASFTVEVLDQRLWNVAALVCKIESICMDPGLTLTALYDLLELRGYQLDLATI